MSRSRRCENEQFTPSGICANCGHGAGGNYHNPEQEGPCSEYTGVRPGWHADTLCPCRRYVDAHDPRASEKVAVQRSASIF